MVRNVKDYCFRFDYQGRGTIHLHVLCWIDYDDDLNLFSGGPGKELSGRTRPPVNTNSKLLKLLENLFRASIDVQ